MKRDYSLKLSSNLARSNGSSNWELEHLSVKHIENNLRLLLHILTHCGKGLTILLRDKGLSTLDGPGNPTDMTPEVSVFFPYMGIAPDLCAKRNNDFTVICSPLGHMKTNPANACYSILRDV